MKSVVLASLIAACGSKPAPAQPTTHEQTLVEALAIVCDAPTRAQADPRWNENGEKAPILVEHMREGVTNERVLAWINLPGADKGPELEKMMQETNTTKCAVHELFATAPDSDHS
jgi:hypothetical protein